jgi:hypothetical protein
MTDERNKGAPRLVGLSGVDRTGESTGARAVALLRQGSGRCPQRRFHCSSGFPLRHDGGDQVEPVNPTAS